MRAKTMGLSLILAAFVSMMGMQAIAKEPPVAKLVQIEGVVEYTRNGTKWNPVSQSYLFQRTNIQPVSLSTRTASQPSDL